MNISNGILNISYHLPHDYFNLLERKCCIYFKIFYFDDVEYVNGVLIDTKIKYLKYNIIKNACNFEDYLQEIV